MIASDSSWDGLREKITIKNSPEQHSFGRADVLHTDNKTCARSECGYQLRHNPE